MKLVRLTQRSGKPIWVNPANVCNVHVDEVNGETGLILTSGPYAAKVREPADAVVAAINAELSR